MRLTIKEPKINIGVDGFTGHCQLGRAETGKKLSDLIEKIEDPVVIALDGAWGSGKSFFLKCWAGAHTKENDGKANVVYFDAFKHDYLDDPLIALTGVLADAFEPESKGGKAISLAKKAITRMWRPAARIGMSTLTAGGSEVVGSAANAALSASNVEFEKASEEFWKKEDGRRAAMSAFQDALIELTKSGENDNPQKVVIIIDELDRCRPDYALSILEVMKHFFAVDNVIFVLGVNLNELQNSVKARYGGGIDAATYLQKFINVRLSVAGGNGSNQQHADSIRYFYMLVKLQNLTNDQYLGFIKGYLDNMPVNNLPNLRSCERLVTSAILAPPIKNTGFLHEEDKDIKADRIIAAGLLIMAAIDPNVITKANKGQLEFETVAELFNLKRSAPKSSALETIHFHWSSCLEKDSKYLEKGSKFTHDQNAPWSKPETIVLRIARMLWGTIQTTDIE